MANSPDTPICLPCALMTQFKVKTKRKKTGFKQLVFTVKIQLLETRALITDIKGKMIE
jgi:hypothetical protein